jgi:thiamine monophosphate synthase
MFVFFLDNHDDDDSQQLLEELENIDDDCDKHGIQFVKIDDSNIAEEYGIENVTYIV